MALDNPPIQEKTTNVMGLFPQVWIKWFSNLRRQFNSRITWFDYNDLTTQSTAIAHTGGATTGITNDGAGPYSTSYNPYNAPNLWNTTTNSFNLSSCNVGDIVTIRFDFLIETTANNQEFDFILKFAIGSPTEFSLKIHHGYFKSIQAYSVVFLSMFYIGSEDVKNYPCELLFESDDNANITVNGWIVKKWAA